MPHPKLPEREYDTPSSWWHLSVYTFAFTVCFAAWMLNGVLITFLVDNGVFDWSPVEMGWVMGAPVLTGALLRLPLGIATDKWGGRWVFTALLLFSAVPMYLLGHATTYWEFIAASVGFGFVGTSFAVGVGGSSVWFSKGRQGLALGVFGAGNAGAALTTLVAPSLLSSLTGGGANPDAWTVLPKWYAGALLATALLVLFTTQTRLPIGSAAKSLSQRLIPLGSMRVWRFGLYYFFVFGGFVALAQWLVPYYSSAYLTTIAMAGILTSIMSLPSGVIRAVGGWMSDKWGARSVMYGVFAVSLAACAFLVIPPMHLQTPGTGVISRTAGVVTEVTETRVVVQNQKLRQDFVYPILKNPGELITEGERRNGFYPLPEMQRFQRPLVLVGDSVQKKQLVAQGVTEIFFQANIWIFTFLTFLLGAAMGIGKAAVYRYIPDYFPNDVGVVGGMVGVIGGLGGFVCPVLFGYLLEVTGLWTSAWMFFLVLILVSAGWMHLAVRRVMKEQAPGASELIDALQSSPRGSPSPLSDPRAPSTPASQSRALPDT